MNTAGPVLVLDNVSRDLAGRRVVRDLSLTQPQGVLGLLGVNGAGKSTTLRMIAGVLAPSAGVVRIDGEDIQERPELARRRIGYLPEVPPLHAELAVAEFLTFCARLHGLARADAAAAVARAIERCGLGDVRRRLIGALSKGFRQRVGLAQAILHDPALVVLDEPASGLDPVQALKLRELVRGLGSDHAVVLSTHVLPDVIACCDRVAILHEGALRHEGDLAGAAAGAAVRVRVTRTLAAADWLAVPIVAGAVPASNDVRQWRVRLREGASSAALAAAIVERGFGLEELRAENAALEEIFMAIAAGGTPAVAV